MDRRPFLISTTVDFPDDCQHIVFTRDLLAELMDRMRSIGVRRVYWNYYQPGWWELFSDRSPAVRETVENMSGKPLAAGCQIAHERGMEFYAIIKPYEMGMSATEIPAGPIGSVKPGLPRIGGFNLEIEPWLLARPELRVRVRGGGALAGLGKVPVTRIQLRQCGMTPIRIEPQNLEIWTSATNSGYTRQDVSFSVTEGVDNCPRDVYDVLGNLVTRKGEPVRVLDIRGLGLLDSFIAVTTDFDDDVGTFRNTAVEMVRAFGPDDQPLPIVVASHKGQWRNPRDVRVGDLAYDGGIGDFNVCLDVTNIRQVCPHCREHGYLQCRQRPFFPEFTLCRDGVIAFARGHNAYLPGSPCEAYPEVQSCWLDWVGECIASGVDGVDWRISNHSSWTDYPELYGFNEPLLAEYQRRYGVNPDVEPYDPELLGALRGEIYDQFLWRARRRLAAAGKKMHVHIEVESFRPDAAQARRRTRPGNIHFNWRRWLHTGLADEATLMAVGWFPDRVLEDRTARDMIAEGNAASVPLHLRHFIWLSRDGKVHADRLERAYRDGGLSGYNLYETAAFFDGRSLGPDGHLQPIPGLFEELRQRIESLSLLS